MPEKDGVEVYGKFYAWPESFRLGDPVLVREVTGMRWPDFVQALDDFDSEEAPDQVVLAGLIAVAFWQGNSQMSRDKARRTIERIPQEAIEMIEGDEGLAEVEGNRPPEEEVGEKPMTTTNGSGDTPASSSDEMSQSDSGSPLSASSSLESFPA